jgi:glycosyltransferase involved in cell wall biosynthesis
LANIIYLHFHFSTAEKGNHRSLTFGKLWAEKGHKIELISSMEHFLKAEKFSISENFSVIVLPVKYSHFMPVWRRALAFIKYFFLTLSTIKKTKNIDFIYASSSPLLVGVIALLSRKKYVFEVRDLWPDVPIQLSTYSPFLFFLRIKLLQKILFKLEKLIYRKADTIISLSDGISEAIIQKGIKATKIITIPNGTDTSFFKPSLEKENLKLEAHFSPSDFIVVYTGTIGIANGCEIIIETATQLQFSNLKFVFIGNGNRLDSIKKMVADRKLKNVIFINQLSQNELIKYLQMADIGLVAFAPKPILETNSANKFFEYLACGLPVVINYEGWQGKTLDDFGCGFSSPRGDVKTFIENIKFLYENQEKAQEMGKNARKLALASFDRNDLAARITNFHLWSFLPTKRKLSVIQNNL